MGKCPEVKLLDYMAVLFLIFWGNSIRFSIVAIPIYNPTNSTQGFSFLHILVNTCHLFDDIHSDRCEVISHCGFDLNFPDVEYLLMCLFAICTSSLEKCLFRFSTHFLIAFFFLFFCLFDVELLCIFWVLTPYQGTHHLQISSPRCQCAEGFVLHYCSQRLWVIRLTLGTDVVARRSGTEEKFRSLGRMCRPGGREENSLFSHVGTKGQKALIVPMA